MYRLKGNELLFGLPVVLDTSDESLKEGMKVLLQYDNQDLGVLEITSKYLPNKPKEAKMCYGTSSLEHPGVKMISMERGKYYLGGQVWGFELPERCDLHTQSNSVSLVVMLAHWNSCAWSPLVPVWIFCSFLYRITCIPYSF